MCQHLPWPGHPDLNPEGLIGGTYSPGDGSASPLLSALAFARQAQARGARFQYNEAVTGILRDNGRVQGIRNSPPPLTRDT